MPLFKQIECITPRVNLKVNYGLWMIMPCQWRFVSCNKCTTLVCDADNVWTSQFCYESKSALKEYKVFKNMRDFSLSTEDYIYSRIVLCPLFSFPPFSHTVPD